MTRSLLMRIQLLRFENHELQARTALAAALVSEPSERERYLRIAEKFTAKVASEGLGFTNAVATLRRAGIRAARGDHDGAVRAMRAAMEACDAAELGLHAHAARVRLGELIGGDEGKAL